VHPGGSAAEIGCSSHREYRTLTECRVSTDSMWLPEPVDQGVYLEPAE